MSKPRAEIAERVVVVGSDFTQGAHCAVTRAAAIAKSTNSRLVLVNVVPETAAAPIAPMPGDWSAPAAPAPSLEGRAAVVARAKETERQIAAELGVSEVESVVRTGRPYETLAHLAESRGARLLVLGVHAPMAPHESFFLGSTSERALRVGSTPVLLARTEATKPYGRILMPVDLGDMSLAVLRLVATTFPDAAYDLVHFLRPSTSHEVTNKERHDSFAASLAGLALSAGLSPVRTRVRVFVADAREGILGEVRARKPDLVAMGTHARTGVARVVLGSVADYVLHAASGVDVLVVPPTKG
jgi:nucleotide-binding universal stress UspA family protein